MIDENANWYRTLIYTKDEGRFGRLAGYWRHYFYFLLIVQISMTTAMPQLAMVAFLLVLFPLAVEIG